VKGIYSTSKHSRIEVDGIDHAQNERDNNGWDKHGVDKRK
jgi:hypothetical protein